MTGGNQRLAIHQGEFNDRFRFQHSRGEFGGLQDLAGRGIGQADLLLGDVEHAIEFAATIRDPDDELPGTLFNMHSHLEHQVADFLKTFARLGPVVAVDVANRCDVRRFIQLFDCLVEFL